MQDELRQKFEEIRLNVIPGNGTINDLMLAAYNLAISESSEKVTAQQQLLESMGETNRQLAKRLQKINSIMKSNHTATLKCALIEPILNPPKTK